MTFNDDTFNGNDGDDAERDNLIAALLEILEQINWSIASKVNPDTGKMEGFIVGQDEFLNQVLTAIDGSGEKIDINNIYLGDNEDLN